MYKRITAIFTCMLSICLLLSMFSTVMAADAFDASFEESIVFQNIDLGASDPEELDPEELAFYASIADELIGGECEELTVQNEDSYTVYTLEKDEDGTEESATVINEAIYEPNDDNALTLVSFSQIAFGEIVPEEMEIIEDAAFSDEITETEELAPLAWFGIPEDIISTVEDVENIVSTVESVVPDNIVSAVEDVVPDNIVSAVEDVVPENIISMAENVTPENIVSTVESVVPENVVSLAESVVSGDIVSQVENSTPDEIVSMAVDVIPEDIVANANVVPENIVSAVEDVAPENIAPYVEAVAPYVTAAPADTTTAPTDAIAASTLTVSETTSTSAGNVFENEYNPQTTKVITAAELLDRVRAGDDNAIKFASSLGLGTNQTAIENTLQAMVDEYNTAIANGETFEEPRFIISGVNISVDKSIDEVLLEMNGDNTYTVTPDGTTSGYKTTIAVDSDASVTIVYDEKGNTTITRQVKTDKPTDFVINLDISGSMDEKDDERARSMFSALKAVLDEILADPENTATVVLWANNSAPMTVSIDGQSVSSFQGKNGITADKIFQSYLMDANGTVSQYTLEQLMNDNSVSELQDMYNTSSGTYPDNGLEKTLEIIKGMDTADGRNIGVMLFTDGAALSRSSERSTVEMEKEIAEKYGAKIVNVSLGDENDVAQYERYLNPESSSYYDDSQVLKDHVFYYNIPKLSSDELAVKMDELFQTAFVDITTETKQLQTETITDGVLAAYGALLIETIPEGFQLVEVVNDNTSSYKVLGTDAEGHTMIEFDLGNLRSGEHTEVSYYTIPLNETKDLSVAAYVDETETVLHTQPVDRILDEAPDNEIDIVVTTVNTSSVTPVPVTQEPQTQPVCDNSGNQPVPATPAELTVPSQKVPAAAPTVSQGTPKTGDNSMPMLWALIALLSGAAIAAAVIILIKLSRKF